jgi:hypothetical protein
MAMFEQFRTVDKAELGTNRSLENHALLVMNALDEAIANMDDPEYLIELLLATGKSHQRFENFSTSIFWVKIMKSSCLFYVKLRNAFNLIDEIIKLIWLFSERTCVQSSLSKTFLPLLAFLDWRKTDVSRFSSDFSHSFVNIYFDLFSSKTMQGLK